jgi:serine/threonine protein phosphatase PrpC
VHLKGKLRCVGMTDTGRVREHNEDTFGTDADIGLVVLADGMGGYKAGEVASGITVRTVMGLLKEAIEKQDLTIQDQELGMSRPGILLRDSIQRANKIIYQTARTQTHCEGMGTTVVAGLFLRRQAHDRARRRLAALPHEGPEVRADHAGPLAAAGAHRARLLYAGGGPARRLEELCDACPRRRAQR